VQPIAELAAIARERRAIFHTDAVQSAGKIPIDVKALGVDLLSISAHKFYGPKGVGALWIRRGVRLQPPLTGGKQERSRRAGTENVAAIAGMGVAAREAIGKMGSEATRLAALRDRLEDGILGNVTGTALNGVRSPRVPNTTNISFDRTEAESLLIALDLEGIAVSTGSACSSGTLEPSHVLKAMGLPAHRTQNSLRFSLGAANTEADIDRAIAVLPAVVQKLRSLTRAPVRASSRVIGRPSAGWMPSTAKRLGVTHSPFQRSRRSPVTRRKARSPMTATPSNVDVWRARLPASSPESFSRGPSTNPRPYTHTSRSPS
jgi:cysteine desulfurase